MAAQYTVKCIRTQPIQKQVIVQSTHYTAFVDTDVHWDKCYHNLWNSAGNVSLIHTFAVTIHPSKRQLTFSQLVHQTVALLVPTINTACIQCSLARELQVTETTILNHSSVKYNVMYSNVNVMYSNVLVSDYARDCGILCTIFKEACC